MPKDIEQVVAISKEDELPVDCRNMALELAAVAATLEDLGCNEDRVYLLRAASADFLRRKVQTLLLNSTEHWYELSELARVMHCHATTLRNECVRMGLPIAGKEVRVLDLRMFLMLEVY